MYLGTILPACHMVEFRVSSFGDSGHLCESIVAFKFSLLLRFVLVMSRAGCKRCLGRRVQYPAALGAGTPQAPPNLERESREEAEEIHQCFCT